MTIITDTEALEARPRSVPAAGTGSVAARRRDRSRPLIQFGRWWWALPAVAFIVVIHYAATVAGGYFAFTDWSGIGTFSFIGLDNFTAILQDPKRLLAVRNTMVLALCYVVLTNVIGLALALALNRGLKTRHLLRSLTFMPFVLSSLAVAYVWKFIFDYNGPVNGFLRMVGLESWTRTWLADPTWSLWVVLHVMVWQAVGIVMVIYLAGLATVPVEIEEAAALDGAGVWTRFRHVVLPSLRVSIAIATTLGVINGLRVFDQVMALTHGGPAGATETLATQVYREAFALGNFGFGAALALILTVVILVFAVLQQWLTRDRSQRR